MNQSAYPSPASGLAGYTPVPQTGYPYPQEGHDQGYGGQQGVQPEQHGYAGQQGVQPGQHAYMPELHANSRPNELPAGEAYHEMP